MSPLAWEVAKAADEAAVASASFVRTMASAWLDIASFCN
jgi:hypothetical protein